MLVCSKGDKIMNKKVNSIVNSVLEIICGILIWGAIVAGSIYIFPHYDNITTNLVFTLGLTDPYYLLFIRIVLGWLYGIAIIFISLVGSLKLSEAIFKKQKRGDKMNKTENVIETIQRAMREIKSALNDIEEALKELPE